MVKPDLTYFRAAYGVPAEVGMRVRYTPPGRLAHEGVIVGAIGLSLRILFDGESLISLRHPTNYLTYLPAVPNSAGQEPAP
jgi:hypothetical protein